MHRDLFESILDLRMQASFARCRQSAAWARYCSEFEFKRELFTMVGASG